MTKYYAIKRPDGEWAGLPQFMEYEAWNNAAHVKGNKELFTAWYKHDFRDESIAACKALGYRCVEVSGFMEVENG